LYIKGSIGLEVLVLFYIYNCVDHRIGMSQMENNTMELNDQRIILEHLEIMGLNSSKIAKVVGKQQRKRKNSKLKRWKYIPRQVLTNKSMDTIKLESSPFKLTKRILKKHFNKFQKIYAPKSKLKIKKYYSAYNRETGFYAYVTFTNVEAVDACFQLDEDDDEENCSTTHEIQGIRIQITRAPKSKKKKRRKNQLKQD
jgi:hypothetical protein